ncbi:MAG: hypothetical protein E7578_06175 [Ruminococcaceae bacterium]|nr:hypothetical protein [Oscillospiraceae bacterium]
MKLRMIVVALCAVLLFAMPVSTVYAGDYFSEDFSFPNTVREHVLYSPGFSFGSDGGLVGGAEAKTICTYLECGHEREHCGCVPYNLYLSCDFTVTLTAVDDPDSENDRFLNLVYLNENPLYAGYADKGILMAFTYDFRDECFRLADGVNNTDTESQLMEPVYIEISDDGTEYYTLGMTVERDRIRCFFNDTLIFDYTDTEGKYRIAYKIESIIAFWQEGNFVHVKNFSVDHPGHLLEPSYLIGDANGDGKINLYDIAFIMKHIAKWNIAVNIGAADVNRDGKINLFDASHMLKYIAGWDL